MPVSRYCALQVNSKGIYIIGGHVAENPFSAQTSIFDPKLTLTSAIGNMIKGKEALLNLFKIVYFSEYFARLAAVVQW